MSPAEVTDIKMKVMEKAGVYPAVSILNKGINPACMYLGKLL